MSSNAHMPAPEAEVFGATVRRLREERKPLTQEQLAHAAGLTTNYLSDIERGVKVPSLTTILQIAHALDLPAADLLRDFTPTQVRRLVKPLVQKRLR